MNTKTTIVTAAALLSLAGCFTVSETEYPQTPAAQWNPAATNVTVTIRGFSTTLVDYVQINGYQTFFAPSDPRYYYGSGYHTVYTSTTIPRLRASDAFLEQAKGKMEAMGFNIMAPTPNYVMETRFTGPYIAMADRTESALWMLCSLLTCDYAAQTWYAKLKIYDNRTGRLVFTHDYDQRYEVTGFSPIPLLGITAYDHTSAGYIQCWCLAALTDRVVADASAFLTAAK